MTDWRGWRPLKGWRVFAGEVGVVLLGVLLALSAQQAVDALDRAQARAFTEAQLREEILLSVLNAFERLLIEPCLKARLAELDAKLAAPGSWRGDPQRFGDRGVGNTPTLAPVYRVPWRAWPDTAWTTAIAADILPHMARDRVARLSDVYDQAVSLRAARDRENAIAPLLTFLNRDQALSAEQRADARTALARLDAENDLIVTMSGQFLDTVRALRLDYPPARLMAATASLRQIQTRYRGPCVRNLRLNL